MPDDIPIAIFDTNIFLLGLDFNLIKGVIYTTAGVINEIDVDRYAEKNRNIMNRIQAGLDSKKLVLQTPSQKYIKEVEFKSKVTGDFKVLSRVDKELIALALELRNTHKQEVILYTNDYSMENLCLEIDLHFSPIHKDGIKSKMIWEVYCPFCQEIRDVKDLNRTCERCGQKLKRRKK